VTPRYSYTLHERATRAIIAAEDSARGELLRCFDALARNPGGHGFEQVTDDTGRKNLVTYTDHFRIVHWTDHAAKEIRITDIRAY
jgi:hypothetical protein